MQAKSKLEKGQVSLRAADASYRSAVDDVERSRRVWQDKTRDVGGSLVLFERKFMS